jgi:Kef-type K+ transport system membrane component KefB
MGAMELHALFLTLGGLLVLGLMTDVLGRRARLPRVTLLIVFGVAVGPAGLNLLPEEFQDWYEFLAATALTMVAFLLGGRLSVSALKSHGRSILTVSITAVLLTALIVGAGLLVMGVSIILAILLAGIATATAPAATQDVIRQANASGPFTDRLLGIVAVDDAWALIVFSFVLVLAKSIAGEGIDTVALNSMRELGGALLVGTIVGAPAAFLTGRLRPGEPIQLEALGLVFLCAGLATWLDVSFLLAGMIAGAIVVNFASHHNRPFHEIENIEWPFIVLFFLLAGASLQLGLVFEIGIIGVAYIVLRTIGRVSGGWIGGVLAGTEPLHRRWLGFALVPQAGVALGMALVASNHFPDLSERVVALTIGTTIVFEIFGPVMTLIALRKVGEATT